MFRRKEYLVVASFALLGFLIINSDLISFGVSKSSSPPQVLQPKAPRSQVIIPDYLPLPGDVAIREGELSTGISLQGTDIPDGLMTDVQGDLKVTLHLKQFFDYFYTLIGRKTEEGNNLRNQYLGSEVSEIFYGMEKAYDQYSLERMRIANNLALSEEERIRASEDLFSSLPPALRQPIEKRRQLKAIREQAQNPGESKERYDHYQQHVQQISDSGLSLIDREQAIKQIKQRLFTASEMKRVNSLDRIGAGV